MSLDPCCDTIIGGEVFIRAKLPSGGGSGTGGVWKGEGYGEIRIQPSGLERTAGASSGGTLWVTEVARPVRALLSFVNRCKSDPLVLWKARCQIDITFIERGRGIVHEFMDALMVGLPEKNLATGEVTGMEVVTDNYTDGVYSATGAPPATNLNAGLTP